VCERCCWVRLPLRLCKDGRGPPDPPWGREDGAVGGGAGPRSIADIRSSDPEDGQAPSCAPPLLKSDRRD